MYRLYLHLDAPFNGFFSRTTWVGQHQKGKPNLDFNKARDDGVAVPSAGPFADHLHLAPDNATRSTMWHIVTD